MKSLSIKIPLSIAQKMDERAELNPMWLTDFIKENIDLTTEDKPIKELTYNYTFKIGDSVHKKVKLEAIDRNLPMNELVGRLIEEYYPHG